MGYRLHRAIALDHGFKKAWMRRGMVRHSRGKYAAAVADFTEVLRLDPRERHALKLREHSVAKEREVRIMCKVVGSRVCVFLCEFVATGTRYLIFHVSYSNSASIGVECLRFYW